MEQRDEEEPHSAQRVSFGKTTGFGESISHLTAGARNGVNDKAFIAPRMLPSIPDLNSYQGERHFQ
jgi:hypothetical protein